MASVYFDVSALYLRWDDALAAVPIPDVEREVELLEFDGHDVFVVGAQPAVAAPWAARLRHADQPLPGVSSHTPAWLIVGTEAAAAPRGRQESRPCWSEGGQPRAPEVAVATWRLPIFTEPF